MSCYAHTRAHGILVILVNRINLQTCPHTVRCRGCASDLWHRLGCRHGSELLSRLHCRSFRSDRQRRLPLECTSGTTRSSQLLPSRRRASVRRDVWDSGSLFLLRSLCSFCVYLTSTDASHPRPRQQRIVQRRLESARLRCPSRSLSGRHDQVFVVRISPVHICGAITTRTRAARQSFPNYYQVKGYSQGVTVQLPKVPIIHNRPR